MKLLASLLFLTLLLPIAPAHGTKVKDDRIRAADIAVNLFQRTCLRHFRSHKALAAELSEGGSLWLPEAKDKIKKGLLDGAQGRVWMFQDGVYPFAVILQTNGHCRVIARRASQLRLLERFRALFPKGGFFKLKETDSQRRGVMAIRYYEILPAGGTAAQSYSLTLSSSDAEEARFQAIFDMGPAKARLR